MSLKNILQFSVLFFSLGAFAQQNPQYSLFMFNKQTINPAYVGSRGTLSINADYRTQWIQAGGNPDTYNVGIHSPLGGGATVPRLAAGVLFSNEELGALTRRAYSGQLAYRLPLGEQTILSFGLEGTIYTFSYATNELRSEDANDPTIGTLGQNSSHPNFSAGLYMYHPRYYVGASSMLLLDNRTGEVQADEVAYRRHYFVMGGYVQPLSENLKLRLNVMNKYVFLQDLNRSPNTADFNLSAIFYDRFLIGASYRTDNSIIAITQFQLTNFLNVAYGFDFKTNDYTRVAGVSHEIYLGIDINGKSSPLTSPRFVTYF